MAWQRYSQLLLHIASIWSLALAECVFNRLPTACYPPAEANVISGLEPIASNTCGQDGRERVCPEMAAAINCDYCDASDPELAHPPELMTDLHVDAGGNLTYWQSQYRTVVQYPNSVVITFPLNKTYDITRVAITFQSVRPESYAIYKSTDGGETFVPFHYFSVSCEATYGVAEGTTVVQGEENVALCTSQGAFVAPLSGGEADFRPLRYRPSAENFPDSTQLQEWVRGTHLQLRLDRLHTLGGAPESYSYAISNVEVSGQCFCNGHAASCSGSVAGGDVLCDCEHNTAGPDCGQCCDFYQDRSWAPATFVDPAPCVACNCNNHSSTCHFDMERYLATGSVSGGVCEGCEDNTEGDQCQRCRVGYYPNSDVPFTTPEACIPCDCDSLGTVGGESGCLQTPSVFPTSSPSSTSSPTSSSLINGQCPCKLNVEGRRCSLCHDGYHTLDIDNPDGCLPCTCVSAGVVNGSGDVCDKHSGQCDCVTGVGGRDCDLCLPEYFNFDLRNSPPCEECGCFVGGAVSNECNPVTGDCQCRDNIGGEATSSRGVEHMVCDSALSGTYCPGLALVFDAEQRTVAVSDGLNGNGLTISVPFSGYYDLYLRRAVLPPGSGGEAIFEIRSTAPHPPETPCPPLTSNMVDVTFSVGSLTQVPLPPACLLAESGYVAIVTALSGLLEVDDIVITPSLGEEVARQLDVFSDGDVLGRYRDEDCIVDHLLVGGATLPDPAFCETVSCSAAFQLFNGALDCGCDEVGSTSDQCSSYRGQCSCLPGFTGRQCDLCTPGNGGPDCQSCDCDVIGSLTTSCDRLGQCRCKPGVGGQTCNTCLTSFYNLTDDGCEECGCDVVGSDGEGCDGEGVCLCREGVRGRRCNECEVGFFNLTSSGCSLCPCPGTDPGSQFATSCEEVVGGGVRCDGCREGHVGDRCELCAEGYIGDPTGEIIGVPFPCTNRECPVGSYLIPNATCQSCDCHVNGSVSSECEDVTGRCECVEGVRGDKCDVCRDGYHLIDEGCIACPTCYNQVAVEFNVTLDALSSLLTQLNTSMTGGQLPADLVQEIMDYQLIVGDMLDRARRLATREIDLTLGVGLVSMDTDELEDLIGRLERNVSLSEEGLARVKLNSDPAAQLLRQLQESLAAVEGAVRGDLPASLTRANELLSEIATQLDDLVALSLLANETAEGQYQLALSLVARMINAQSTAQETLRLLSEAIAIQNDTSVAIVTLQEVQLSLDATLRNASSSLMEAELRVPLALSLARAVLERVRNISVVTYDTALLEARIETLQNRTDQLATDTATASGRLVVVEGEVGRVRERADQLIIESGLINLLSIELLARAHAALTFANRTVDEGNEFIASVKQLLVDLQQRLVDNQGFVASLEEVIESVELAEELAGEAEEEGERRREDLRQAVNSVDEASLALAEVARLVDQALQVALSANRAAVEALMNANHLSSQAEELAVNVTAAEERVDELGGVVSDNARVIAMATETAQTVSSDVSTLQGEIEQLLRVLEDLQLELDSTELLPGDRLLEVGAMVTQLESQADSNQVILDALQDQVGQLESSSSELRERHTSLQQHRDLLQSILSNIQQLDCRNQFQSI